MILKALADYYDRLGNDPHVEIAPPGFERKPIDFLIVLDQDGEFKDLRDIREGSEKKRKGRISLVPKSVKRSVGIAPNLLWDTAPYVLAKVLRSTMIAKVKSKHTLTEKKTVLRKLRKRGQKQQFDFIKRIEATFENSPDTGIQAVLAFLKSGNSDTVCNHTAWQGVEDSGGNISFVLVGEPQLVCQRPDVVAAIIERTEPEVPKQTCAISGKDDVPAELHTAIKGVWGAQSSGANIVSFNLDAFRSFGKKQGFNAPIGQQTEFAYTTALNYLLASGDQRMQIGDASTVFWAQSPCDFEKGFAAYLNPKKGEEAVSYARIKGLLSAVKSGIPPAEGEIPFYVLGLAPNASRIAIRFWFNGNVKEIKERVAQHFADIEMVRAPLDPEDLSIARIISATTRHSAKHPYGDSADVVPHLAGELFDAVIKGTSYPRTLLQKIVNRVKAEQALCDSKGKRLENVTFARAALLKGFLVRARRFSNNQQKEVSMALDRTYDNIGYALGRLFAVLECIQEQTQEGGLNKTIRDTYFGGAASSPQVTFKRLDNLSVHHLAKLRHTGKNTVWLEQLKQEIYSKIPAQGIPAVLTLEDQGRFAVGYYHQRQDFFKKKETTETKGDEE